MNVNGESKCVEAVVGVGGDHVENVTLHAVTEQMEREKKNVLRHGTALLSYFCHFLLFFAPPPTAIRIAIKQHTKCVVDCC